MPSCGTKTNTSGKQNNKRARALPLQHRSPPSLPFSVRHCLTAGRLASLHRHRHPPYKTKGALPIFSDRCKSYSNQGFIDATRSMCAAASQREETSMARPPLTDFSEHRTARPAGRPDISSKRAARAAFAQLCKATALLSSAAMTAPLTVRLVTAGPSCDDRQAKAGTTVPAIRHVAQTCRQTPMNRLEELGHVACR